MTSENMEARMVRFLSRCYLATVALLLNLTHKLMQYLSMHSILLKTNIIREGISTCLYHIIAYWTSKPYEDKARHICFWNTSILRSWHWNHSEVLVPKVVEFNSRLTGVCKSCLWTIGRKNLFEFLCGMDCPFIGFFSWAKDTFSHKAETREAKHTQ